LLLKPPSWRRPVSAQSDTASVPATCAAQASPGGTGVVLGTRASSTSGTLQVQAGGTTKQVAGTMAPPPSVPALAPSRSGRLMLAPLQLDDSGRWQGSSAAGAGVATEQAKTSEDGGEGGEKLALDITLGADGPHVNLFASMRERAQEQQQRRSSAMPVLSSKGNHQGKSNHHQQGSSSPQQDQVATDAAAASSGTSYSGCWEDVEGLPSEEGFSFEPQSFSLAGSQRGSNSRVPSNSSPQVLVLPSTTSSTPPTSQGPHTVLIPTRSSHSFTQGLGSSSPAEGNTPVQPARPTSSQAAIHSAAIHGRPLSSGAGTAQGAAATGTHSPPPVPVLVTTGSSRFDRAQRLAARVQQQGQGKVDAMQGPPASSRPRSPLIQDPPTSLSRTHSRPTGSPMPLHTAAVAGETHPQVAAPPWQQMQGMQTSGAGVLSSSPPWSSARSPQCSPVSATLAVRPTSGQPSPPSSPPQPHSPPARDSEGLPTAGSQSPAQESPARDASTVGVGGMLATGRRQQQQGSHGPAQQSSPTAASAGPSPLLPPVGWRAPAGGGEPAPVNPALKAKGEERQACRHVVTCTPNAESME
jgi:hypothetical protein